eukprot:CAMPEP_0183331644 /NCGR_PEP_ID=MMETSP0164_2-20130417/974_1 /TAXON_ID=221442 /ORGANISM="Coccolithus pelagicus ssp braarudi, Strain PLY182g" /LENGTH=147 /DNA_ID=CAMNT_0025500183 /DNA_START=272 /DNA_END=716 /DNA_ORIENTATION=+
MKQRLLARAARLRVQELGQAEGALAGNELVAIRAKKLNDESLATSAYVPGSFVTHGKMPPLPAGLEPFLGAAFLTGAFFTIFLGAAFTTFLGAAFLGAAFFEPPNITGSAHRLTRATEAAGVTTRASAEKRATATRRRTFSIAIVRD